MNATSSLAPPDVAPALVEPAVATAPMTAEAPSPEPGSWTGKTGCVGYVAKMFPRISETFILDEVLALRRSGVPVKLYSLLPPVRDARVHPEAAPLVPEVEILQRTGPGRLRQVLGDALFCLRRRPRTILRLLLHTVFTLHPRRHWRRLEGGMHLARCLLRDRVAHIHAAWANNPETVVRIAGRITGIPWSMGAHAKDIHLVKPELLAKKIAAARFTVTCTAANRELLTGLALRDGGGERNPVIDLVHHGVDATYFAPAPDVDRAAAASPVILSVGRLVPKKGFPTLLAAAARLAHAGAAFRLEIIGEGPERHHLKALIATYGLKDHVTLRGIAVREEVRAAYAAASCFVLACCIGEDGDRDGIPNTIAEAMASGLPVVSTRLPGIEEIVRDRETGRLVPPDDPVALADALADVLADRGSAAELGRRARAWVLEHFDAGVNGARRARRLGKALGIERVLYVSADRGVPIRGSKGASVHVRSVVAALASAGVETRILTAREGRFAAQVRAARLVEARSDAACGRIVGWIVRLFRGGEPLERAILRLLDNFWLHAAGRQLVSSWRPDLVYERYALTAFAGARLARHLRVPFVLEVNSPLASEEQAYRGLRFGLLARWMERRLLRRAARVVVVSRALEEWVVRQGVPPEKVLLLPNAGVAAWSASESDACAIRARHGLDGDAYVVGFCGSLKPWHGVTHLLEAAARVANTIPRLRLLFVGDGPERPALERRAAALGVADRVRFTGAIPHDDVPSHLAACDALAAPYERIENFYFSPLKIAEYLQSGRPVLVSSVGDIPNMVDGAAQVTLLPPANVEALANALSRVACDGRTAPAVSNGSASWTWDTVVRRILAAGEEARRMIWAWTS